MIAYRQAREKLIERVSTFTTESPIGPLQGYAYRSPFDSIAHAAFVYNGIGDGKNVLTRLHKPNIVKDLFTGQARMQAVLNHFKKAGRGVLVYLRDGAAGVPVEPVGEAEIGGSRSQPAMARGRRRRADPARSRRHLDPPSHLVGARLQGTVRFRHRDRLQRAARRLAASSFRDARSATSVCATFRDRRRTPE